MNKKLKPKWYFSGFSPTPDFGWQFFGFGLYVGRVKDVPEVGNDLVFNVYTPWFSFGYAW